VSFGAVLTECPFPGTLIKEEGGLVKDRIPPSAGGGSTLSSPCIRVGSLLSPGGD